MCTASFFVMGEDGLRSRQSGNFWSIKQFLPASTSAMGIGTALGRNPALISRPNDFGQELCPLQTPGKTKQIFGGGSRYTPITDFRDALQLCCRFSARSADIFFAKMFKVGRA